MEPVYFCFFGFLIFKVAYLEYSDATLFWNRIVNLIAPTKDSQEFKSFERFLSDKSKLVVFIHSPYIDGYVYEVMLWPRLFSSLLNTVKLVYNDHP